MIKEYWNELEVIWGEYLKQNKEVVCDSVRNLFIEQLQELIEKKEDPSYEINMEVMKEQE